jgi:Transglycosylase-like domain
MRPKTTTAVALAGTLLAVPAALAAEADDPPSPTQAALRAPVGGHLTLASQMRAEAREARQAELERRAVRLARRVADARGGRSDAAALRGQSPDELHERMRELRRELSDAEPPSPVLEAIAACESGGDPTTDTGNGFYGKYQFDLETWQSVGGSGSPADAPEAEQDRRAAILYAQAGASPWPVCGR